MDDELSAADWRRGRQLLRDLLPWAKAELRKTNNRIEAISMSALGTATSAHVTEDNLDAMLIYAAPKGGWHVDITFKHVPPGVPNIMGTPVESPLPTRRQAEERGKHMLVLMLKMAEDNKIKQPSGEPVFMLYDGYFRLLPQLYQAALAGMPEGAGGPGGGYDSREFAIERIEETLADVFPDGFSREAWNRLDKLGRVEFLTVLHIAALTGVFAYPPREDAAPKQGEMGDEGVSDRRGRAYYH